MNPLTEVLCYCASNARSMHHNDVRFLPRLPNRFNFLHHEGTLIRISLVPRPLPDFISQLFRKIGRPGIITMSRTGNGGLGWCIMWTQLHNGGNMPTQYTASTASDQTENLPSILPTTTDFASTKSLMKTYKEEGVMRVRWLRKPSGWGQVCCSVFKTSVCIGATSSKRLRARVRMV